MTSLDDPTRAVPEVFRDALADMRGVRPRAEISLEETAAPRRIAPHSAAFAASVPSAGQEGSSGRLVLLYDPDGQEGWDGTLRLVTYLRAEVDPEIGADPLLAGVGWSWLMDALHLHGASYRCPAGTVTRSVSEGFGALAESGSSTEVELHASWTPVGPDCGVHLRAWSEVLATAAGLDPESPAVTPLRSGRHR